MRSAVAGILVVALAAGWVGLAEAGKTYTPAQLRKMVAAGKFPDQGPVETKVQRMDYTTCIASMASVVESVQPDYPTKTIMSSNIGRIEKVWTNDAAMTLTCSAPDGKLVITTAKYK